MNDFDKSYPDARSSSGKPGWPEGIRSISMDGMDYLGVDGAGRLYWDGKPIKMASRFELTDKQGLGAVLLIAGTLSLALFDALRFFGFGVH